ncbi:MAG TPA: UDP-4-amino-4,6-dideoxy-N-acetyl-beta-L-altrosamine transaminase [Candidatus Omnitrophota bacterium]|nr:UDP-4-amino-4,6-dideoxy-N-acetyl-beta-L-altrosamine transaminase [Candidatus Omnitrophota bacterium]
MTTQTFKKIPYGRQWVGREEIRAVTEVLKSDFLTQGAKVPEFERALARKVGSDYAVAVANGTAALHLAAIALELKPGDEVITTPISFLATSNAIIYAGARPVFGDIDPETQCIDPRNIESKITKRTRAIFVTDFAGHPADMAVIYDIAGKHKLKIVEDAAHALGSVCGGSRVGSCRYADMTIFSFHPVKHITTGEGGAITTNDSQLREKLRELRTHGVTRDPQKLLNKKQGGWYYEMQSLGFNYRLTDIQAAIGIEQLKKSGRFIERRREIAKKYTRAFSDLPGILTPVERSNMKHVYHLYVIRLQGKFAGKRQIFFEQLHKRGIGAQVHYIPIPEQPYYRSLGYTAEDCPNARSYYASAVSLPMYPGLTNTEVHSIIKAVKDICHRIFR